MDEMIVYGIIGTAVLILVVVCIMQAVKLAKMRRQLQGFIAREQELSAETALRHAAIISLEEALKNEQELVSGLAADLKTTREQLAAAQKEYSLEKEKHWQTKQEAVRVENDYLRLKAATGKTL